MKLKDSNSLLVTKKEDKYATTLNKLELLQFTEGVITTGNYFLMKNFQTSGYLVIDTDDKNSNYSAAFAVTTNPLMNFPCPRSLFKIEKYCQKGKCNKNTTEIGGNTNNNNTDSNIVTYGEKICIVSHPDIFLTPLYIFSSLITPQSFSRFSRNQEVLANSDYGYSSSWVIEHPDTTLRYSMEGKPVFIKDPFVIRHCSTGRLLGSDLVDYFNDYGHEFEVCCNNFLSTNKYQTLGAEKAGNLKIDTKTKLEKEQNVWVVIDQI
jgi:hypothetical protein